MVGANGASKHDHATILVLDYGSQYTQLITRRVREVGLFSLLFPGDASLVSDEVSGVGFRALACSRLKGVLPKENTHARALPSPNTPWWG